MRGAGRADQAVADQAEQYLLLRGNVSPGLSRHCPGGNDRVMIADFCAVDHLPGIRGNRHTADIRKTIGNQRHKAFGAQCHIIRQILAVRPGVSDQFLFIQRLSIIQRLLRRESENPVRVSLQRGQIVQFRRIFFLFPAFHFQNPGGFHGTGRRNPFRLLRVFQPFSGRREAAAELHRIELLRLEFHDCGLPFRHQKQGRRHDTPDIHRLGVNQGKKPAGVNPYQPVCLLAAKRRFIQQIKILAVPEMVHAVPDRAFLQGRDPKAFHRFCAAALVIDEPENQFSFAAGIRRADHFRHLFMGQQEGKHIKLILCFLRNAVFPRLGEDRKILPPPFLKPFVVFLRHCQFHQMADTPADDPFIVEQITRMLRIIRLGCADHFRDRPGNGRFFRDDQPMRSPDAVCLITHHRCPPHRIHPLRPRRQNWIHPASGSSEHSFSSFS